MRATLPPIPTNESARLSALSRYHILDTPPEAAFDDIARLAALLCQTPMALITLVDKHRQWFKAAIGIEAREMPRECSFCAHTINRPTELMVVPDATADQRFSQNPLVQGAPHVRFYAGAPLVTPEGFALGALCVVDRQKRELTSLQQEALRVLAGQVMSRLEQRRILTDLALRLETAQRLAHVGDWVYDIANKRHDWSAEIFHILGVSRKEFRPTLISALTCVHTQDRRRVHQFEYAVRKSKIPMEIEHRIVRPDGKIRHLRTHAEMIRDPEGNPMRMTGTVQDITEYQLAEEALHESEKRYKLVSRATSDVLWAAKLHPKTMVRSLPDAQLDDLHDAIAKGGKVEYDLKVQLMNIADELKQDFDPLDPTKTWPENKFPLMPVGKMILDRNPDNFFTEVEQAAFCPASLVPGIEFSADKLLQGRTFSYADTQRHRLGPNYLQLTVNKPLAPVDNNQRDGAMQMGHFSGPVNYEPNTLGGGMPAEATEEGKPRTYKLEGEVIKQKIKLTNDFAQGGNRYRSLVKIDQDHMVDNLVADLTPISKQIQNRVIENLTKADAKLGRLVAKGLKL